MPAYQPPASVFESGKTNVGALFSSAAAAFPLRTALVEENGTHISYADLDARTNRLANCFIDKGFKPGDRVAVLSENRSEYIEVLLAAAKCGVIVAALNWRLGARELSYCIELVEPSLLIFTERMAATLEGLPSDSLGTIERLTFGDAYENVLTASSERNPRLDIDPETGLVILYTSGTTGLPKGALVSHRAMISRATVYHIILHVPDEDNFIAWTPMYHMVATDHGLATLMRGGTIWIVDGYKPELLIRFAEEFPITWFVLVPGMVGTFVEAAQQKGIAPKRIRAVGAMADLIPAADIAAASKLLKAPFLNTFGATETGLAPATGGLIPIGVAPTSLSKTQTPFSDVRLVDSDENEVDVGTPGEVSMAGPTLFSGYWNNDKVNQEDFRHGRFHMGDVMRRNPDGTLDYVDRVKYMIKSGGENIYPAEIEMVILADERAETVVVVRQKDDKWGEVPIALVVRKDDSLTREDVVGLCDTSLSRYKRPKAIYFVADADLPRSTTGKIQRHLIEEKLHTFSES